MYVESYCLKGGLFFSKVAGSSCLLNGWGKEFWRSARGWASLELGVINLMSIFLGVREFFVLPRMVGRTWRGILTTGYLEPCNFPSFQTLTNIYKKREMWAPLMFRASSCW